MHNPCCRQLRNSDLLHQIVLPSYKSKEAALLFVHTLALAARTFISIYVSHLDGVIVKTIVDGNPKAFSKQV